MSERPELTPEEAVERWLSARAVDSSDATVSTYRSNMSHVLDWLADQDDVQTVGDLGVWDVEAYQSTRRQEIAVSTAKNELGTLRLWLRWCARKGLVDDTLAESVDVPSPSKDDLVDETRLDPDAGVALVEHYTRTAPCREGVLFAVLWTVGCRMGGFRALDVRDFDPEQGVLTFRHRPTSGTPLKNKTDGERAVTLTDDVADLVARYVDIRDEVRDDFGRVPLVCSERGRPALSTIREWTYAATIPCRAGACPHDRDPDTCDWTAVTNASQCPSSRSPHQVRTGSITWQLDQGVPVEAVSERVNSGVSTIRQHYDQPTLSEARERRASHVQKLHTGDPDD